MFKKSCVSNVEKVERRKHWRDRRGGSDRRHSMRLGLNKHDCRSRLPRRTCDIAGELTDGEIWWNNSITRYE